MGDLQNTQAQNPELSGAPKEAPAAGSYTSTDPTALLEQLKASDNPQRDIDAYLKGIENFDSTEKANTFMFPFLQALSAKPAEKSLTFVQGLDISEVTSLS